LLLPLGWTARQRFSRTQQRGEFFFKLFFFRLFLFLLPLPQFLPHSCFQWKSNILSLMWNQVDLNARTVRLNPGTTKNDAGQIVALDGELLEAIQAQWEKRRVVTIPGESLILLCPYVFDRYDIVSEDDLKEAARMTWEHAQSQDKITTNVVALKSGQQG
jgi:integrase